ncbi:hypothetical protein FOZ63_017911, partial [Perkinsus olseni]
INLVVMVDPLGIKRMMMAQETNDHSSGEGNEIYDQSRYGPPAGDHPTRSHHPDRHIGLTSGNPIPFPSRLDEDNEIYDQPRYEPPASDHPIRSHHSDWRVGLVPVTSPPVRVSQQAVVEASPSVSAKLPTRSRSTGPARHPEGPHRGPSGFIYDPTYEGRRGSLQQPTPYGAAVGEGWSNSGGCQDKSKRHNPASPKESCSSEDP